MEKGFEASYIDENLERQKLEFEKFLDEVVEPSGLTFFEYAENNERETFEGYLSRLGLTETDLVGKKTLDIGAAEEYFASYALKNGISDQIYSVKPGYDSYADKEIKKLIWPESIKQSVEGKTVRAIAQSLPFQEGSFELIVNKGAMPGKDKEFHGGLTMEQDINASYDEIVRVLKDGGQARLSPFDPNEDDEVFDAWAKATKKKLEELSAMSDIDVIMEKIADDDESFRIILRKNKLSRDPVDELLEKKRRNKEEFELRQQQRIEKLEEMEKKGVLYIKE
jgi:SAM-dependent methyltransferase